MYFQVLYFPHLLLYLLAKQIKISSEQAVKIK